MDSEIRQQVDSLAEILNNCEKYQHGFESLLVPAVKLLILLTEKLYQLELSTKIAHTKIDSLVRSLPEEIFEDEETE